MNILIVGLGSIAQKHIEAIEKISENPVFYALRSSLSSKTYGNVNNVFSIEEINSLKIDFAIISNPTSEHKKTIDQLSEFGFPLFIEKPLFHTLDMKDLLCKVMDLNILTYVACNLRFLDCLVFIKKEIDSRKKRLNEVNVYCGSYLPEWRTTDFRQSYSAIPQLGGGVHIDLIHEIDYLYWIFGAPQKVNSVFKNNSSLSIEAFDYANYNFLYDEFSINVVLNYYRRDYKRTFELVFEDETWLVDLKQNAVFVNQDVLFTSDRTMLDTYEAQMNYFVDLVQSNNKSSFNSVNDAYDVLTIALENETKR